MKVIVWMTVALSCFSCSHHKQHQPLRYTWTKEQGYVPNATTAIKIAEATWLNIYGEAIYDELPFQASSRGDTVWTVSGTLTPAADGLPILGGAVQAEIRKADGCILIIAHEK